MSREPSPIMLGHRSTKKNVPPMTLFAARSRIRGRRLYTMRQAVNLIWNGNLFAAAVLAIVVAPQFARADSDVKQCPMQNATMQGTYVTSGTGTIPGVGAITTVGLVVYNGDGTGLLISSTTSVNGMSSTSSNVPATFTVNRDCTGQKTIGKNNFNFVITPDGGTIYWIITNAGITISGTGVRHGK